MTSGRNCYSNLVDLWALGVVVHQILTSELPFQDTYDDSEFDISGVDMGSTSTRSATIDMHLLFGYCEGVQDFPTKALKQSGVTADAVDFVTSLMAANPKDRVSAPEALRSIWLCAPEPLVTFILLIVSFITL